MRLYLMTPWDKLEEAGRIATMLETAGHVVTNHFLKPGYCPPALESELTPEQAAAAATECIRDIVLADMAINLNLGRSTTGGLHREWGIALGLGKLLASIGSGGLGCVFDALPGVVHYKNTGHLIDGLSGLQGETPAEILTRSGISVCPRYVPIETLSTPAPPVHTYRAEMLSTLESMPGLLEIQGNLLELDENGITTIRDKAGIVAAFYPGSVSAVRRMV